MVGSWGYIAASAIGVVVGAAELVSRHSDRPLSALQVGWGVFYLVLNALFSLVATLLIDVLRPTWITWPATGTLDVGSAAWLTVVAAAGFGSAAVFRSGIMKVRGADGEVTLGPGAVADVFLKMADDAVDRTLGVWRIDEVSATMAGVDFDLAKEVLPPYCFAALRRFGADQQAEFARQLVALEAATGDNATKTELLGLALIGVVGPKIVLKAVTRLGNRIRLPPPSPIATMENAEPMP